MKETFKIKELTSTILKAYEVTITNNCRNDPSLVCTYE
jgi:hypothetical protein